MADGRYGGSYGRERGYGGSMYRNDDYRSRYREDGDRYRGSERSGPSWFADDGRDRDRDYGPDDYNSGIPMDETERLIASNKVEGTAVYGRNGERLGSIHNLMIDKYSGQVEYAVLKYSSGFLGFGEDYCPLPWRELEYDRRDQGYRINMSQDELKRRDRYDSSGRRMGRDRDRW